MPSAKHTCPSCEFDTGEEVGDDARAVQCRRCRAVWEADRGIVDDDPDTVARLRSLSTPDLLHEVAAFLADEAGRFEHPALVRELEERARAWSAATRPLGNVRRWPA